MYCKTDFSYRTDFWHAFFQKSDIGMGEGGHYRKRLHKTRKLNNIRDRKTSNSEFTTTTK